MQFSFQIEQIIICAFLDENLPYTHALQDIVFLNSVGVYIDPTDVSVIRTLNEFFYGSRNLDLHIYAFFHPAGLHNRYTLYDNDLRL